MSVGSYRLSAKEEEEMQTLGFSSASAYLKYKLGKTESIEFEVPQENNEKAKLIQPVKSEGMTTADAVKMAKLEFERERLLQEKLEMKSQLLESLGSVELNVSEKIRLYKEEEERNRLRGLVEEKDLQIKKLKEEFDTLKAKYKKNKKKLERITDIKELTPTLTPVLGAISTAISKGGGFSGVLGSLGEALGNTNTKLSPEDEKALALGKDITGMFTQEEFQKIMELIAFFSIEKNLIDHMPPILEALKSKINNSTETID